MLSDPVTNQHILGLDRFRRILSVVLVYAVIAALWILLSDKAVVWLFNDPALITLVSTLKGWLFVVVTSLLLYGLMRRCVDGNTASKSIPAGSLRLGFPFVLLATVIVALTGTGIFNEFIQHKKTEIVRLQAIADLKTRQITDWLRERQGDADFVQTNDFFSEQYSRWQESDDLKSRERLQKRLEQFRQNRGFGAVMLLNPKGEKLWGSDKSPLTIAPPLQAAAQAATAERKVLHAGPYRGIAGNLRLDFVAPLTSMPGPAPLVILHIDPADWLFSSLQTWPVSSATGETLLYRRDGDHVLFLNELRHRKDTAAKLRIPLATKNLLAAQVMRGDIAQNSPVEGTDYRGIPAIGVVRAIAGTDWFLMAKLDKSELYAKTAREAAWISFIGLLTLFMAAAGFYLLQQNQQLALAQAVQQSQAERLSDLSLLAAIADNSDDAIFAKDLEGRYILINRAARQFVNKPPEEVLGHDDRAFFPPEQAEMLMAIGKRVIAENRTHTQEEMLDFSDGKRIFLATKGPLRDAEGKVTGIFGISRDITEQKHAADALQASELSYRSLFENMLNSCAHCLMLFENGEPRDFIYLNVNKAFEAQTGLKNVVGRKVSEVIPGICESDPGLFEIYGRVAMSGQPETFETYVEALHMWFSISVYSPQREYFIAIFDVITERKLAEQALRDSAQRFRQLFDLAPVPLSIISQDGVIITVNNRYISTFGYTPADVPTLAEWWQFAYPDPDYRRRVMATWNAAVQYAAEQGTNIEPIECRVTCKGGEVRTMVISGSKIGTDILASFFDITERKADEETLRRQAEELAQHNAELERFNRAMVGRELDIIAVKQQVNALSRQLGQEPPYPLAFLDAHSTQPKQDEAS